MGKRLGKIVRERMDELDMSARAVSRNSGGLISHTVVSAMANGLPDKTFEKRSINAVASALQMSPTELFKAYDADMADVKPRPWVLPAEADTLSAAGRKALVEFMHWLLDQERKGGGGQLKRGRRPGT